MNLTAKVATGNRRRVLENGPDVMRSDEEDAIKDVEPDEEHSMYAQGCTSLNQAKMSQEQAAAQRAAAQALARSQEPEKVPPRSQTPIIGSSDDDDPNGAEMVWSQTKGCMRKNKNYGRAATDDSKITTLTPVSAPMREPIPESLAAGEPQKALPAPPKLLALNGPESRIPTPVNSDDERMTEDQKRLAKVGKKMSRKGTAQGTSRPKPATEAQASHPMATRKTASRAGSLRSGGGSGQTDTCVASGNPSKT
jgi:hypothetical protein